MLVSDLETWIGNLDRFQRDAETRMTWNRDQIKEIEANIKAIAVSGNLGEPDGPWWVHIGWEPYGTTLRWSEPNGPFHWKLAAEMFAVAHKGHVVRITASQETPFEPEEKVTEDLEP